MLADRIRSQIGETQRGGRVVPAEPVMAPWTIPQGTHYFNAPLVIEDMDGVTWRGYGSSRVSRLVYTGPPTKGFIQLIGASRCRLENFEIVIASPGVDAAILVANHPNPRPNTGRISTANEFENIRVMHGGKPDSAKYAFSVDSPALGGTEFNNEHHRFIRCLAQHYSVAGFHLNGHQAHQIVFDGCAAHDAGGRRPVGLLARSGAYFRWMNGSMTNNSIDFKTSTAEHMSVIEFHSSELSTQFYVSGRVGAELFVSMDHVRWDGNPRAGVHVIDCFGPGPWSIRNSWFSGVNGVCPTMRFAGYVASPGSVDMSGVMIRQHAGTVPTTPLVNVPATWGTMLHGVKHQRINEDGTRVSKPIEANKPIPGPVVP